MEWLKLIATLISGGAMGAIITLLVSNYRNRIQPIGYKLRIDPIFSPKLLADKSITKITFSGADKIYDYDNLYLATLYLKNVGNKDLSNILIGVTVTEKIKLLRADITSQDRHHLGKSKTELSYDNLKSELDFELSPLNRTDTYEIKFLLTTEKDEIELTDFKLSSPSAIKFKALSLDTFGKIGTKVLAEMMSRFP